MDIQYVREPNKYIIKVTTQKKMLKKEDEKTIVFRSIQTLHNKYENI